MAEPLRFDTREVAGAVADLGVLVPIAVALIVRNGLSPTAVLLPAGVLYIVAGLRYRLPIPVQPLKAFGAIAIARGLGVDEIAAGALLMGVVFVVLGQTGLLDAVSRLVPRAVVRGVQLAVGVLFLKIAWGLLTDPPDAFADAGWPVGLLLGAGVAVAVAAVLLRARPVALALVGLATAVVVLRADAVPALGPAGLDAPHLTWDVLSTALVVLVLPQLPLTFVNSCLATADAARTYFGERAAAVRPGRLAVTLGSANLFAGAIGGMPVCHGAGGLTAHRSFGARTGAAPVVMGTSLVVLALTLGSALPTLLTGFPLPVLAGLLAVAGALHLALLRDLDSRLEWLVAGVVGIVGLLTSIGVGVGAGLLVWVAAVRIVRPRVSVER